MAKKKRLGVGASCSSCYRYVHPAKLVDEKYPNARKGDRMKELICLRKEMKKVSNKQQMCAVFRHEAFDTELHVVLRWIQVEVESATPFDDNPAEEPERPAAAGRTAGREIPEEVLRASTAEDINRVRAEGFDVDDDNEPAPEHVPAEEAPRASLYSLKDGQEWKKDGICKRRLEEATDFKPKVKGAPNLRVMTLLSIFQLFFPFDWFESVLLANVNKNIEGPEVTLGEMLRWIGIWFYMATFKGFSRGQFWSSKDIDDFEGAPVRFHAWMSQNRFNKILAALQYTDQEPPAYRDPFHQEEEVLAETCTRIGDG